MSNDQPIRIQIKVDKAIPIIDLKSKIIATVQGNSNLPSISLNNEPFTVILYSSTKGAVRGVFSETFKLNQYNLLANEVDAIEVLTETGKESIKTFY